MWYGLRVPTAITPLVARRPDATNLRAGSNSRNCGSPFTSPTPSTICRRNRSRGPESDRSRASRRSLRTLSGRRAPQPLGSNRFRSTPRAVSQSTTRVARRVQWFVSVCLKLGHIAIAQPERRPGSRRAVHLKENCRRQVYIGRGERRGSSRSLLAAWQVRPPTVLS